MGLGCVFPGAPDVETFWENVLAGRSGISTVGAERWNADTFYDPDRTAPDRTYCKVGGFIRDWQFDGRGFRIPPATARVMDRAQQYALTAARQAVAHAGFDRRPFDRDRTAVIIGIAGGRLEHEEQLVQRVQLPLVERALQHVFDRHGLDADRRSTLLAAFREEYLQGLVHATEDTFAGLCPNVVAGRIANFLDVHGPNYVVDAACASSLAAVDSAAESLRSGDIDLAVCGGVNAHMGLSMFLGFSKFHGLSPERVSPFDEAADGFLVGEGAGFFLLKRLDDAVGDGDRVLAVVRGVGASSDGREKGIGAPNAAAQALAIRRAFDEAGYSPGTVQLLEAHGAGTSVGDPAEIAAANEVFGPHVPPGQRIAISAVKSQVGHLMGAAGAVGLMKTVLGLHHKVMPPTINHTRPASSIPWEELPFEVLTAPRPWAPNRDGLPRRASVSSFGFGGNNYHLTLEEFDPRWHRAVEAPAAAAPREPIAIVAEGACLPRSPDVETYWTNVLHQVSAIDLLPGNRWDGQAGLYVDPNPDAPDKCQGAMVAFAPTPTLDPRRLRVSPVSMAQIDPGQRQLLAIALDTIDATDILESPEARRRTAVIIGDSGGCREHVWSLLSRVSARRAEWTLRSVLGRGSPSLPADVLESICADLVRDLTTTRPTVTEDSIVGIATSIGAARIAKAADLMGAHMVVDAACGSSLAAIGIAVRGLQSRKWDAVVTGGTAGGFTPHLGIAASKARALSATGSRPFDTRADGFVVGEGSAVFVLKRLSDAIERGNRIHAVIRGVGSSSDGRGHSMYAPDSDRQAMALQRAYADAGVPPSSVQYVECHATSTPVGDASELSALRQVFGSAGVSLGIGSVKSQIGHTMSAAGAAGLLKVSLGLERRTLPPMPDVADPITGANEEPFHLVTRAAPWPAPGGAEPRRAGVSSFGFGGTNWHVVVEEFVPAYHEALLDRLGARPTPPIQVPLEVVAARVGPVPDYLFVAAGATPQELSASIARLGLDRRRAGKGPWRLAFVARSRADLQSKADLVAKHYRPGRRSPLLEAQGVFATDGRAGDGGPIAGLFPGQGPQYADMLRDLADEYDVVQHTIAEANDVLREVLGETYEQLLFTATRTPDERAALERSLAARSDVVQPVLVTAGVALYRLVAAHGVGFSTLSGHSLGEYAALVGAGALDFAQAIRAAHARGQALRDLAAESGDAGSMAMVTAGADVVAPALGRAGGYVAIANRNCPLQTVVSGDAGAVREVVAGLEAQGVECRVLPIAGAFHSRIAGRVRGRLETAVAALDVRPPAIRVLSSVDLTYYEPAVECGDRVKANLVRQLVEPVDFIGLVDRLHGDGIRVFVEIGPKNALAGFVDDILGEARLHRTLFVNHPKAGEIPQLDRFVAQHALVDAAHPAESPAVSEGETAPPIVQIASPPRQARPGPASGEGIWITGVSVGLPGRSSRVFSDDGLDRLLAGACFIEPISEALQDRLVSKRITRLVKTEEGEPYLAEVSSRDDAVKLAAQRGGFSLRDDFGLEEEWLLNADSSYQLAVAAGLECLRDARIPLQRAYRRTSRGGSLRAGWMLPPALQDDTAVVFASAFPGHGVLYTELERYYAATYGAIGASAIRDQYLKKLQEAQTEEERLQADQWFMDERRARRLDGTAGAYRFNRNFLSDYVCMGNTRFAQLVHARGPNLAVNAACCSTAVALAAAEDMIRLGRARRVVVLAADDVSADVAFEWIGSGFLAAGAAATDRDVADAAIPFDRRRHGMIIGMGAVGFVVEPESAARERGLEPVAELLGVRCANSASHMTRPDADHVIAEIDAFLEDMRARHGIDPREIASNLVYGSHETFTLPTGGIGTVEGRLLKHVFGDRWRDVVVVNTKCATGHAQGAGLEEAIIIKALQAGKIPPVLHSTEIDPELAGISLSSGGPTDREYALRFSAGFGSQVAMVLTRVVTRAADRTTSPARYQAWLDEVTGVTNARVAVVKRVLQVQEAETATAAARVVNQPAKVSDRAPEPRPAAAPALHAATAPAPVAPPPQSGPVPGPPPIRPAGEAGAVESRAPTPSADEITERVIAIIEEKTGYERQYLELDLDLEADLGIDTIKQAQVMGRIRETFALPKDRNIRVKDFPTLRHVVQYVQSKMGGTPVAPAAVDAAPRTQPDTDASRVAAPAVDAPRASADSGRAAAAPPPPPTAEHVAHIAAVQTTDAAAGAAEAGAQAAVLDHVLRIIEKQTGYEREALDLDLDLEADLGIDTIKQAQVMARLRETFSLPREQGIRVKDFPTIRHVVGYITSRTGAGSGAAAAVPDPAGGSDESRSSAAARTPAPAPGPGVQEPPDAPDGVGRMAVEWAAHPLADEQPNLTLDAGWTVLITDDGLGVADALSRRLAGAGATVEVLRRGQDLDVARHRLGRVRALVLLHPLAPEPAPAALDARGWRDVLERKAVASFRAIKAVRGDLEVCVGVTAMSGPFGWRGQLLDPAGAGVAGLLKTLRHEAAGVLVKAVDVDRPATKAEADHLAAVILAEVERGGRRVEVAYRDGSRLVPRVVGAPLDLSGPGKPRIGPQSVIVAIGGSRGVTSAIVKALARRCHPRLVLVATRPLPGNVAELASLDADGLKQLKEKIARGWKARVTGARPIEIERKYAAALQAIDAYRTIETCESAGAAVSYEVCDVRDADRVRDLIRNVVREYGRLDGVIFGAGTIEDKLIEDKTPESFDRVFGVKAEGIFNLYKALDGVPLSFLAAFSSVAGRFGNAGQADYAAGNEVLARFVALMQAARPDARCVVFDWTGWEQVGLAARSGVIELLKDSGFDAVTPEEGARFFHEELAYGDGPVEVAITGASLPIDKDGQMVPALGGALPDLSSHPRSRVFLGAVRAYARGAWLSAATTLEPRTDTWLRDHVIDGAPLMPAVFGIEMMAEAACLLFPDLHLCSVRDLKLHLAVKVLKDRPTTLNVIAVGCAGDVDEERVVRVRVTSNFVGPDGRVLVANRVHYTCEMLLRATPPVAVSLDPGPLATLSAEMPIPPLYGEGGALPHGPTFRVIERVDGLDGTGVVALVAALDETRVFPALNGHRLLTLPFAREAAFQSAGLWGILRHHNFGLPHGCRTLHLFGAPPTGTKLLVRVRPKAVGPVRIEYDIDLLGDDGRLYDRMEGFYTVNPLAAAAESGNGRPGESRG